ncbi:MAG: hypothetical protein JWM93_3733 [Frankiales bacterium]|nr:hypothetical protein [Frankiales bacterium]
MSARITAPLDRRRLGDRPFTIVANNCWGGSAYQYLGRRYNSPFVGLFIDNPDFLRLTSDLRGYLSAELEFRPAGSTGTAYPVGVLGGDVEIHFMHYADERDASVKWMRRRDRMDWSAVRVVAAAEGPGAVEFAARLHDNRPEALVLGPEGAIGIVGVSDYENNGAIMFFKSLPAFDLVSWLSTGVIIPPLLYQRLLHGATSSVRGRLAGRWRRPVASDPGNGLLVSGIRRPARGGRRVGDRAGSSVR